MPEPEDARTILDGLHELFSAPDDYVVWVAGRVLTDRSIVVLTRRGRGDRIWGDVFEFKDFWEGDGAPSLLSQISLEVEEPARASFVSGVDWAERLVDDPSQVLWRAIGPGTSPDQVTPYHPPQEQSHEGAVWYIGWARPKPPDKQT